MINKAIVSILHHSIPDPRPNVLAEEENIGWHYRTAKAFHAYANYSAVSLRPGGTGRYVNKMVEGVLVALAPSFKLSPVSRLWKWNEVSLPMANYAMELVAKHDHIPYIHEYRSLNSELVMRKLVEYPMILQHHGSNPPMSKLLDANPLSVMKELSKSKREKLLKRIQGAVFVLNVGEKEHLEKMGVKALIKVREMAVDFNKLRLVSQDEKRVLRRKLGIPEEAVVLCSYVGIFREDFSTIKGAHLVSRIWKHLNSKYKKSAVMIVTGLGMNWAEKLRNAGLRTYGFLPHDEYLDLLRAADIYVVPATSAYRPGGIGVSVMEALALGTPVISPTLANFPEIEKVERIGAITPFVDGEMALKLFLENLACVVETASSFRAEDMRQLVHKYYSWESFLKDFSEISKRVM